MVNYHLHTNLSIDCKVSAVDMCTKALDLGITHIAITDHYDLQDDNRIEYDINKTIKQYKTIKEMFLGTLDVACGIELGQSTQNKRVSDIILGYKEIDFVLSSLHNIKNEDDFYFMDYTKIDNEKMLHRYYDEVLQLALLNNFDSLAHLDYPKRYLDASNITLDYTVYNKKITEILNVLIKNNKALELNTSGIGRPNGDFMPARNIIQLYYDLGGRNITIGSDCHKIDKVDNGLQEGYSLLKEVGITDVCIYKQREQTHIPI